MKISGYCRVCHHIKTVNALRPIDIHRRIGTCADCITRLSIKIKTTLPPDK